MSDKLDINILPAGAGLKNLRRFSNTPLITISKALDVSVNTYRSYEANLNSLRFDMFIRLAQFYKIDTHKLLDIITPRREQNNEN